MIARGEIWLTRLAPTIGQEIQKTRPCLIVSPEDFTPYALAVIVPLTSGSRQAPYRVPVRFDGRDGFLLPEQVRTVSRRRMTRRLGRVDPETLNRLLATLREMFEE